MQMLPRTGGEEKLKYVLRGYLPENIHNADKTTCFIICYKTRYTAYRGENWWQEK
jgi:hypothetical protein